MEVDKKLSPGHLYNTFKRIATRTQCSIQEAVYWYNVVLRDDVTLSTAPADGIYQYMQLMKGIDKVKQNQKLRGDHIK